MSIDIVFLIVLMPPSLKDFERTSSRHILACGLDHRPGRRIEALCQRGQLPQGGGSLGFAMVAFSSFIAVFIGVAMLVRWERCWCRKE